MNHNLPLKMISHAKQCQITFQGADPEKVLVFATIQLPKIE